MRPSSLRRLIGRLRSFLGFFAGSLAGLVVDVGGFATLVALHVPPAVANVLSSSTAVVVVYLLVTRYAFGASRSALTFLLFAGWYGLNIAVTSTAIGAAVVLIGPPPLLWKLCSIPLSFAANYLFGRLLFRRRRTATPRGAVSPVAAAALEPVATTR